MNNDFQKKYQRRAHIIANLLRLAPFIRMVALAGSLARGEVKENSDIDFFIVTKTNRIWSARIFATILVQLSGFRRYNNKITGRICLNCYQTEDYLTIGPKNQKNAWDYSHLIPLWQSNNLYQKFKIQNIWIEKYRYRFRASKPRKSLSLLFKLPQALSEFIYELFINDWGEEKFKRYQTEKILNDPQTKKSPKGKIYISDKELRFHPLKTKSY